MKESNQSSRADKNGCGGYSNKCGGFSNKCGGFAGCGTAMNKASSDKTIVSSVQRAWAAARVVLA